MARLSDRDFKDILLVTRAVLECGKVDDLRREALLHLERIFKCHKSTFFLANCSHKELRYEGVVTRGFDSVFMDRYREYYHRLDPYVLELPFHPSVVNTEQLVSFRELMAGEYYNDFLRPQSIHFQMAIILRAGKRLLGAMAFLRPRSAGDFTSRDRAKAEYLAPVISEILDKGIHIEFMEKQSQILKAVSDESPEEYILLDELLEVIHMSEKGKSLMTALSAGKWVNDSRPLPEEIYTRCEELKKESELPGESGESEHRFTLKGGGGKALPVSIRTVRYGNAHPAYLIFLKPSRPDKRGFVYSDDLGLSKREQEVVMFVGRGLKNREIANKLHISRFTVENHLKTIFQKLGVSNRTALSRVLYDRSESLFSK